MKDRIKELFLNALEYAKPSVFVDKFLEHDGKNLYVFGEKTDIGYKFSLISVGKAGYDFAKAFSEKFNEFILSGIVASNKIGKPIDKFIILEGSHPVPDKKSLKCGKEVLEFSKRVSKENTPVVFFISGGASAILAHPAEGLELEDKIETTKALLLSGAEIKEINSVRKHISSVKGGRLAQAIYPSKILNLVLSDIVGDPLEFIGSGPTFPDSSTFEDAMSVIKKYNIENKIPKRVINHLKAGIKGKIEETLKYDSPVFKNISSYLLGRNFIVLSKIKEFAENQGIKTVILTSSDRGEAKEVAKFYSGIVKEIVNTGNPLSIPALLVSGGELTVKVKGNGKGGRNQEFVLWMLKELEDLKERKFVILSAGTDGIDGNSDAAGAVVDSSVYKESLYNEIDKYLDNNDSYNFLKRINSLIMTGPTGTNVMDVRMVYIE